MTEWYILMVGDKPTEVILGRVAAVHLLCRHPQSTEERRRIARFLEGGVCDLGSGIRLAGVMDRDDPFGGIGPDVQIVRVLGPGSLV